MSLEGQNWDSHSAVLFNDLDNYGGNSIPTGRVTTPLNNIINLANRYVKDHVLVGNSCPRWAARC